MFAGDMKIGCYYRIEMRDGIEEICECLGREDLNYNGDRAGDWVFNVYGRCTAVPDDRIIGELGADTPLYDTLVD